MSSILDISPAILYNTCDMSGKRKLRLGNHLRVARAEKRLSQEYLARMAGVTRQTIGAIENGQYCPSAMLAFVLARELERPVSELFHLEEETQ